MASSASTLPPFEKPSMARLRWRVMQDIVEIARKSDGVVFGGYVRDMILHDHYADMFYSANAASALPLLYGNSNDHPESWPWRTYQPNDIDVQMTDSALRKFQEAIEAKTFHVAITYEGPTSEYIRRHPCGMPNGELEGIMLTRMRVSIKIPELLLQYTNAIDQTPFIAVDVMHKESFGEGENAPFGDADFECNTLLLRDNQISAAPKRQTRKPTAAFMQRETARIIEDIKRHRAVAVRPQDYRSIKMIGKGFTLVGASIDAIPTRFIPKYEGTCIMCHGDVSNAYIESAEGNEEQKKWTPGVFMIKNSCCDARYHPRCYKEVLNTAVAPYNNIKCCIMCRGELPVEHVESPLIKSIFKGIKGRRTAPEAAAGSRVSRAPTYNEQRQRLLQDPDFEDMIWGGQVQFVDSESEESEDTDIRASNNRPPPPPERQPNERFLPVGQTYETLQARVAQRSARIYASLASRRRPLPTPPILNATMSSERQVGREPFPEEEGIIRSNDDSDYDDMPALEEREEAEAEAADPSARPPDNIQQSRNLLSRLTTLPWMWEQSPNYAPFTVEQITAALQHAMAVNTPLP